MAKVQKEQNGGKVEVFRVFDNVPLCAIRKASNAEAKLPARRHGERTRTRTEREARSGGGYLLRNQMRLYEIYDGENCCLEETDGRGRTRKM